MDLPWEERFAQMIFYFRIASIGRSIDYGGSRTISSLNSHPFNTTVFMCCPTFFWSPRYSSWSIIPMSLGHGVHSIRRSMRSIEHRPVVCRVFSTFVKPICKWSSISIASGVEMATPLTQLSMIYLKNCISERILLNRIWFIILVCIPDCGTPTSIRIFLIEIISCQQN